MTRLIDQEQEQMWESVEILSQIDMEKAKTVLKATIEKAFRQLNIATPILSTIRLSARSFDHLTNLRETEKKMREAYGHQEREKAYEYLVDYIEQLSELIEEDSVVTRNKLYASLLFQSRRKPYKLHVKPFPAASSVSVKEGKVYYKPSEVAKKLGLSDQTIRRMCEKGKFQGAYKTDGGHWRIPQDAFITTPEQDQRASEVLHRIDLKNKEVGNVDEFHL
jgi:excisionase family DNA binding protein